LLQAIANGQEPQLSLNCGVNSLTIEVEKS